MRKLRLDLEELEVESFETERSREQRGTVRGYWEYTYYCDSDEPDCTGGGGASCYDTVCHNQSCHSCNPPPTFTCVPAECV